MDAEGQPPTPEDEERQQKIGEGEAWLRELEQNGCKRRGSGPTTDLHHPDDPEISVFFDPYTGEVLFSPKYIEWLKPHLPVKPR